VPAALGDIIDRLLSKSRDARFATGDALRQALDAMPAEPHAAVVRADDSAPLAMLTPHELPTVSGGTEQVLSSVEAQEVWARAAELQANTGMYVPPAEFTPRTPGAELVTRGYDATLVKDSAREAGIESKYVDRALAERANAAPVKVERGPQMQKKINPLAGGPTKLDYEATLDGELTDIGFEELADEVRRQLGEMVTVSAVGRTMSITTAMTATKNGTPRRVQVNISSRNGKTNVRANEDLSQFATSMFVGITVGGGVGAGSAMMGAIVASTHNPAIAPFALLGTATIAYTIARFLFTRATRKRDRELRELMERVVQRAREFVVVGGDASRRQLR
jgi:serine/threonine-protein kinase